MGQEVSDFNLTPFKICIGRVLKIELPLGPKVNNRSASIFKNGLSIKHFLKKNNISDIYQSHVAKELVNKLRIPSLSSVSVHG